MAKMMMEFPRSLAMALCAAVLILYMCGGGASALRFDIHGTAHKCFSEELHSKSVALGNWHVLENDDNNSSSNNNNNKSLGISTIIVSPDGSELHVEDRVREGKFAFTADESGDHALCFWIPDAKKDTVVSVELDWKIGIAAKDWESVAKRDKLEGVELELAMLQESVKEIHDNLLFLRAREEILRHENEVAQSRMALCSISSLSICLIVAALQVSYLKSFFVRKKLL